MRHWVVNFLNYPASRKLLVFEAGLLCIQNKIFISSLPFRWIQKLLDLSQVSNNTPTLQHDNSGEIKMVFQIVDSISRHIFWTNTCLVRSLTIKILLRRRNIYSQLFLGVAKDGDNKLKAHAWVKVPSTNQVYDDGSKEYTTVAILV